MDRGDVLKDFYWLCDRVCVRAYVKNVCFYCQGHPVGFEGHYMSHLFLRSPLAVKEIGRPYHISPRNCIHNYTLQQYIDENITPCNENTGMLSPYLQILKFSICFLEVSHILSKG